MDGQEPKSDSTKSTAEGLAEHVREYVETYVMLAGVKATEKVTGIATISLTALVISFLTLCIVIFLGVGVAVWAGELLQNTKAGYFCVAGFYLLCAGLFLALRKKFIFPAVRDHIIRNVYE